MKSQLSKRSPLKRILVWLAIQTPIVLYFLVAASLSAWYDEPTNPLSSESIRFIKIRPDPLHEAIGFAIYCLVLFALIFPFAAWKAKRNKIDFSGYISLLLVSFFFGLPTIAVANLLSQDVLHNMGIIDSRDAVVALLEHFSNSELSGMLLGGALVLLSALALTWKRPKPAAMRRMCTIAGVTAMIYIAFGLTRLALIQINPEWIYTPYQQHYFLIGGGIAQLSTAICLRWALLAVHHNRELASAHLCKKCNYDLTGITSVCPECGTAITPQTS